MLADSYEMYPIVPAMRVSSRAYRARAPAMHMSCVLWSGRGAASNSALDWLPYLVKHA
jgi:hypothetical protein